MYRSLLASFAFAVSSVIAGVTGTTHDSLHLLPPITHGNLTIFPVVGGTDFDTSHLLTLDEGVKAGTVIVTEQGALRGLIRGGQPVSHGSGAEVNRLVLVNNSDRPLLLLAGEIVTGGKQDRVIGADRLVPAHSDPIDLSVFCVEPGRWVGASSEFTSMKSQMAQPSVRMPAMAAKNQQQVWDQVAQARSAVELSAPGVANGGTDMSAGVPGGTTSYARTMAAPQVKAKIDTVAGSYSSMLGELKKSEAKGVVVAVNGQLVWADIFASNDLLVRYWEKLVRSYAAESLTTATAKNRVDQKEAQEFLDRMSGSREIIETEAGIFRRSEITGNNYKVFTLTALLPKTDYNVHTAKMSYEKQAHLVVPTFGGVVR
jgi:ARG and Rhodanese-Phosphatase-superfamily-associated Protein domain